MDATLSNLLGVILSRVFGLLTDGFRIRSKRVYNLVVALSSTKKKTELSETAIEALVEACAKGQSPYTVAKKIHPDDRVARQRLRRRIIRAMSRDPRIAQQIGEHAKAEMLVGLIPAAQKLASRATRRTDATKLLFETTGFHNPRVQHEHSGDIKVSLSMPRPTFEQDAIDVPEADVVEE